MVVVMLEKSRRSTSMIVYRLKKAAVTDDGEWWLAVTKVSLEKIQRDFEKQNVGGILYDTVNWTTMQYTPGEYDGLPVVRIKLRVPKGSVERAGMDLCLSEIGIGLLDPDSEQDR